MKGTRHSEEQIIAILKQGEVGLATADLCHQHGIAEPRQTYYRWKAKMRKLNRELRHWEKIYNTVRPHQSLGYLTPHQFLLQISSQRKE